MKKLLSFCLFTPLFINGQNIPDTSIGSPITTRPTDFNIVFTDDFNYSDETLLNYNWNQRNGEKRWLQEQVYFPEMVNLKQNSLYLSLSEYIGNTTVLNGNGRVARIKGAEVESKTKYIYGYFEGMIRLPSGKGSFPGFWLFPMYRERFVSETNPLGPVIGYDYEGYPEEIDIIEQRSVKDIYNGDREGHLNDFYSFWNNMNATENRQVRDQGYFFTEYGLNQGSSLAGGWHKLGLKWDLFGQYWYIDDKLIFWNNLWRRPTNTESMSIMLSNQVITNPHDSNQVPLHIEYPYNPFSIQELGYDPSRAGESGEYEMQWQEDPCELSQQHVIADYVNVYQEKKFGTKYVWASGRSDRLGNFKLNDSFQKPDTFIIGNFIDSFDNGTTQDPASEIFTFSGNALRSAFQKLSNNKRIWRYDLQSQSNLQTDDNWDISWAKTIKEETRATAPDASYTLNNWFNDTIWSSNKFAVGDFILDGSDKDQLFMSNSGGLYSVLMEFDNNQVSTIGSPYNGSYEWYLYQEKYNNGGNQLINFINNSGTSIITNRQTHSADIFLAGNFISDDIEKELLWINPSATTKIIALLDWNLASTGNSNRWKLEYYKTPATIGVITQPSTNYTISASDKFLVGNFFKQSSNDQTDELLIYNPTAKTMSLWQYNVATKNWSVLWSNTSTSPKTISTYTITAAENWVAGNFKNYTDGTVQLMSIPNSTATTKDETKCLIFTFSLISGNVTPTIIYNKGLIRTPVVPGETLPTIVSRNYMPYKFNMKNNSTKTLLLSITKYKNPYNSSCTGDDISYNWEGCNCFKYESMLTDFTDVSLSSKMASEVNFIPEKPNTTEDISKPLTLTISPNPTTGELKVDFSEVVTGKFNVYDVQSKEVINGSYQDTNTIEMNLTGHPAGIYFITFVTDKGIMSKKVIIE